MLEFELGQNLAKGDFRMAKKHFQAEQIIGKLRETEVEIPSGERRLVRIEHIISLGD